MHTNIKLYSNIIQYVTAHSSTFVRIKVYNYQVRSAHCGAFLPKDHSCRRQTESRFSHFSATTNCSSRVQRIAPLPEAESTFLHSQFDSVLCLQHLLSSSARLLTREQLL
jgi:hypothetical protein